MDNDETKRFMYTYAVKQRKIAYYPSLLVLAILASGVFSYTSFQLVNNERIIYAMFSEHTYSYSNYLQLDQVQAIIDLNTQLMKLEPMFQGSLVGYERYFYDKCVEYGLPFDLALAITLHESAYGTSDLALYQYNYGGLRGGPNGWASFNSPEEGIDYYLNLLKTGYFDLGATTPETIQPIYCPGSTVWVSQIYAYMDKINTAMYQ